VVGEVGAFREMGMLVGSFTRTCVLVQDDSVFRERGPAEAVGGKTECLHEEARLAGFESAGKYSSHDFGESYSEGGFVVNDGKNVAGLGCGDWMFVEAPVVIAEGAPVHGAVRAADSVL
jgi:hypothetical protein